MRVWMVLMVAMLLVACDDNAASDSDAEAWVGSIGRLVIDGRRLNDVRFEFRADAEDGDGEMAIVAVDDAGFDQAIRLSTLRQQPDLANLAASIATGRDVDAGESCWLHLNARVIQPQIETGLGRLSIAFESVEARKRQAFDRSVYVKPTWTPIDLPFKTHGQYDAGEARVVFGIGTQLQVIDIADVSLRCFDSSLSLDRLPQTAFSYVGRAPDAPWREIAAAGIERYRMGDLQVRVIDADGQPVPDADIHVQMTRHAFKFGTAVDAELLAGTGTGGGPSQYSDEQTARYRQLLKNLFNTVTFENSMSWPPWVDAAQRRVTEDALAWIKSLDVDLRGSPLISPRWDGLPRDLREKQDDPEFIRTAVRERVSTTVGELDGRISEWDVVDRPLDHHDLMDLLGWQEMDEWFRLAKEAAPEPRLVLNEYDVLAGDRLAELVGLVGSLIDRQVPIDAIGIKGHFGVQPPSIQVLSDRLDQLASFDLPLVITEFDMDTDDEQLQADFTRDLMTLAFSHPSVEGIVFWGFWEGRQAVPQAAMYRQDWTIKPNGEVYRDLVLGEWWTDVEALSNADGVLLTRGILGDYTISATKNGRTASVAVTLERDGASVEIQLAN